MSLDNRFLEKIDLDSDDFKMIAEAILLFNGKEIFPSQRSTQCNALLYLTIIYLNNVNIEPNPDSLIDQTIESFNDIIDIFVQRILIDLNENLDNFDYESYNIWKTNLNFLGLLRSFFEKISDKMKVEIPFHNTLSKYYLGIETGKDTFESQVLKFMKPSIIESKEETLHEGISISNRYILLNPLSQTGLPVWKVKDVQFNREAAMKLYPLNMLENIEGLEDAIKKGKIDNITSILKANLPEYQQWSLLKAFPNKSSFMTIGYSSNLQMAYIVMELYAGSLNQIQIKSKWTAIWSIFSNLKIINSIGYTYNNLDLSHVMVKYNDKGEEIFNFIGFRRVIPIGSKIEDIRIGGYTSLNLLRNGTSYPYDDMESLFYLSNDLYSETHTQFQDIDNEIEKKTDLSIYMENVRVSIEELRKIRGQDLYVATGRQIESIPAYIEALYDTGFPSELLQGTTMSFTQIVMDNISIIPEVTIIPAELHPSEEALVRKIKIYMQSSPTLRMLPDPDEMALKIMNVIMYGVTYSPNDQRLIDTFLNEHLM